MYTDATPGHPIWGHRSSGGLSLGEFAESLVEDGGTISWFAFGRDAVARAAVLLDLGPGDEVLVPASICADALEPFLQRSVHLRLYGLDHQLQYDCDELAANCGPATKAIYLNHYFGFPQDPEPLRALSKAKNIPIIEDRAHAPLSRFGGNGGQTIGDLVIYSWRKFLPAPDGGMLVDRYSGQPPPPLDSSFSQTLSTLNRQARYVVEGLGERGLLPLMQMKRLRGGPPMRYPGWEDVLEPEQRSYGGGASTLGHKILLEFDLERVISIRRRNYLHWLEAVESIDWVQPLYPDCPEGIVPYSCPVLVPRQSDLYEFMLRHGISLEPTLNPTYRAHALLLGTDRAFSGVADLAGQLLSLPVHQNLSLEQLDHIASHLKKFPSTLPTENLSESSGSG